MTSRPIRTFLLTALLLALATSLRTAAALAGWTETGRAPVANAHASTRSSHNNRPALAGGDLPGLGHSYPLIGWQTFTGAVDDFYARFELLVYRDASTERVARLKELNPGMKVIWTFDWNTCETGGGILCADEWVLRDSQGNKLSAYGKDPEQSPMMNLSEFSPRAESGSYPGLSYPEAIPEIFEDRATLYCSPGRQDCFDGWGTNGAWGDTPGSGYEWLYDSRYPDVDIDLNCPANGGAGTWPACEDHNQFTRAEWIAHWQAGIDSFMQELRERLDTAEAAMDSPRLLAVNSGTAHTWGWTQTNGVIDEKLIHYFDDSFNHDYWTAFASQGAQPLASVADGMPPNHGPDLSDEAGGKEAYRYMRFGLVTSMFNDVYYSFQDKNRNNPYSRWPNGGEVAQEHYWSFWYDEFEAHLGQPTSKPLEIEQGLWARFFEKGAALAATDGGTHTATDGDLSAFAEYEGPYYRFLGGQDPLTNDGTLFERVTLEGYLNTDKTPHRRYGDGLLLFKEPVTLVAEIIVDNVYHGTSPGSAEATLEGGFTQHGGQVGCTDAGTGYYTLRCTWNPGSYAFATAPGGVGAQATFRPTIGVAGTYEVFEWHPQLSQAGATVSAVHTIHHANGTAEVIVDQSANPGRWNSLGTYRFEPGASAAVVISAPAADGALIADAVKLVFRSTETKPTFGDVPFDHWAHDYIEALYREGYVAGCSTDPAMYCPHATMTRSEGAVFVERGLHGAGYLPPAPLEKLFQDVPLEEWYAKWAHGLWEDGYTAGCGVDPLVYCPLHQHTRAEACVFFLRMLHGPDYLPPKPTGIFSDVPLAFWGAKWIEAAYHAGLIPACESDPELRFCPLDPLDRAMAAYMMVQAKDLVIP
jgi:hypothetical protein